jgi:NitT/TauT family transport system substrate-binding protein
MPSRPIRAAALVAAALAIALAAPARAEIGELRIAQQFGLPYLPLIIAKKRGFIEEEAGKAGLGALKVSWVKLGSGSAMNDALLSGSIEVAAGGVGPLLKIWDKTRGKLNVRGIAALGSMPLYLTTTNPAVHAIRDFGPNDRIALPAVKVSIQALILQMAAAQAFGAAEYERLDPLTVSMTHPDGVAALLSGGTEITAHFSNPPYQEEELRDDRVHKVLSSYEVLRGPTTVNSLYATGAFAEANPRTLAALVAALQRAAEMARGDLRQAAADYVAEEKSPIDAAAIAAILDNPDFVMTIAPQAVMTYARFMHEHGLLGALPGSWKDVYFPAITISPAARPWRVAGSARGRNRRCARPIARCRERPCPPRARPPRAAHRAPRFR